jgi:hypothetical protein
MEITDTRGELARLVPTLKCFPGWSFELRHGLTWSSGAAVQMDSSQALPVTSSAAWIPVPGQPLFLVVTLDTLDSTDPDRERRVLVPHPFLVPEFPVEDWGDWVLRYCVMAVLAHEACEWFEEDGVRTHMPDHGPEADLYAIRRRTASSS